MEKTFYYVDNVSNEDMHIEQYGQASEDLDEIRKIYQESLHANGLDLYCADSGVDADGLDYACNEDVWVLIRKIVVTV